MSLSNEQLYGQSMTWIRPDTVQYLTTVPRDKWPLSYMEVFGLKYNPDLNIRELCWFSDRGFSPLWYPDFQDQPNTILSSQYYIIYVYIDL